MKVDSCAPEGRVPSSSASAGMDGHPDSAVYWEDYDGLEPVAEHPAEVRVDCPLDTLIAAAMDRLMAADDLASTSEEAEEAEFEVDPTLQVQALIEFLDEDGLMEDDVEFLETVEAALTDTVGPEGFSVCFDVGNEVADDGNALVDAVLDEGVDDGGSGVAGARGRHGRGTSGVPGSAHLTAHGREKRRLRNQKDRRRKRAAAVRDALMFRVKPQLCARFMESFILHSTLLHTAQVSHASTAYKGKSAPPGKVIPTLGKVIPTLEDLLKRGYQLLKWDGRKTVLITDAEGRIIIVLGNAPKNPLPMGAVNVAFKRARDTILTYHGSVRGPYWSDRYGWTYGSGEVDGPHAFAMEGRRKEALDALVKNRDLQQCAGHASALLAFWCPLKYARVKQMIRALHKQHPELPPRPMLNSIYTTMSFNLGPRVVTYEHVDTMNYVGGMCSVTCGGNFDYTKGGHLYFTDLKLVVEFPPGGTILLPSSLLRHGNTALQKGEERFSFTQYCPSGLFRWEDQEFETQTKWSKAKKAEYRAGGSSRWMRIINTFSRPSELAAHHIQAFE